ncbi:MAG TPA: acetyl-CoA carboxylase biotin carboxyl carrier protein [Chitinophagaceae bacterium]|nr:acetyl-CoA carboxylase biotin carboxyl carrier protein [Chitinophagaceae bacterium]
MDLKQIQELIKIMHKSQISELSIEEDKFKITIKQKEFVPQAPPGTVMPNLSQAGAQNPLVIPQATAGEKIPPPAPKVDNLVMIKSPMIGTFYRSPAPDKPSFINIGDEISPGKVVCVIEAMKLFNEIESEVQGKIVKVLVEDSSPVEYDQPLFLVEP